MSIETTAPNDEFRKGRWVAEALTRSVKDFRLAGPVPPGPPRPIAKDANVCGHEAPAEFVETGARHARNAHPVELHFGSRDVGFAADDEAWPLQH